MRDAPCQRNSDYNVLAMFSHWFGQSQIRIKVRAIGKRKRIIVDIEELSPDGIWVEREYLNSLAQIAASEHGHVVDPKTFLVLRDYRTTRSCGRLDGTTTVTNVVNKSYAFGRGANA